MTLNAKSLRAALLGAAVAGALGFGGQQAFATPDKAPAAAFRTCPDKGFDYAYSPCALGCPSGRGYCAAGGICQCGDIP